MATPFDSIGGLLGIDPEQLKQLMAALGPQEEDRKAANMQALTQLGLGLLGTRKGYEWEQLGNAGQNALMARQQALQGAQAGRMDQVKMTEQFAKIAGDQNARKAAEAMNNRLASLDMYGGGDGEGDAQPPQKAQRAYDNAMRKWQIAIDSGDVKRAEGYLKAAESVRVKYGLTPQVLMKDGKPVIAQMSEFGDVKEMTGYSPKPEYKEVDTGKQKMFYDPLTGAQGGQFAMQTTPGQDQSAALQRAQMAQTERHWQAGQGGAGGGKPQLVNGQWVFPPDAQNPTGRAVTPEGMSAGAGKALTESQAKATAFVNQMQNATATINDLESKGFDGKTTKQQAQIVAAGSEGVPFVPGSAALPRFAAGPQAQQYFQAELQWTEGALRFMTGANAPKEEVIRNAATYFPRPGDSNEVIKRKKEARQNMEDSIRLAAGAGSEKVPPKNSGAEKTIVRTGTNKKTGKRVILYSDGTQVEQ